MINKLFFCENCRDKLEDVSKIHFVEDHSDRGFCSEKCILDFYRPYMQAFENEEDQLRQELNIPDDEGHNEILGNDHYLQLALKNPSEIWQVENDLNQKFYTHILDINVNGETLHIILICSYVDSSPSFVFYRTLTATVDLLNKYRRNFQVEISDEEDEYVDDDEEKILIEQEILEQMEFKKSFLLADLLDKRKPDDIDFEEFQKYDHYMEKTLDGPDEIYEYEDDEGDILHTCIKSYQEGDSSFFYVLIAIPYKDTSNSTVMIPVLGFPSNDKSLYPKYAIGKRIDATLKN